MSLKEIIDFLTKYLIINKKNSKYEAIEIISYVLDCDPVLMLTKLDYTPSDDELFQIKKISKYLKKSKKSFKDYLIEINKDSVKKVDKMEIRKKNNDFFLNMSEKLKNNNIDEYKLEAELVFSDVLKCNRMMLFMELDKTISDEHQKNIETLIDERAYTKRPIQYIIGYEEFYGYKFYVDERVLIPRPETEMLVEKLINLSQNIVDPKILELGVGSGCISITLAKELSSSKILGVDISKEALDLANKNKTYNEVKNLKLIYSDMFSNVDYNEFDIIVSNPPYIPEDEYNSLDKKVKDFEPKLALTTKDNGYYYYEMISRQAGQYLKKGGILAFEVGYNQAYNVKQMMEDNGFKNVLIYKDLENIDRMVIGEKA